MRGTTFDEDWERLVDTFKMLWPNPFERGFEKKTRLGDFLHALMNIPVEATRRHPQRWTKVYLSAVLLLLMLIPTF